MSKRGKQNGCDDAAEQYLFTCKDCGSHDLYVEYYYTVWQGAYWTAYVKTGLLNLESTDEHRIEDWNEPEEIDSAKEDTDKFDENEENEEAEVDEDSEEFYLRCNGCNKEIEFGWSHPDRGGRIWPSECIDFNPWLCWPEPRYREKWAKKGWLRPKNGR
ncbi:MAG: hypothetical protein WBB67_04270 [bacterium]